MTSTVSRIRPSLWRAGVAEIVGLLLYVGLAELIVVLFRPTLDAQLLLPVGLLLAVIPAVIWLAFFYAQDRAAPEPRHHVLAVSVLGALLATAVGQPFINDLARAPQWLDHDVPTQIIGSILVVGVVQEFLKYAAVRYSIYYSAKFDERVDGVLYGTAAGLGYATVLNVSMIVNSGGIAPEQLGAGVIRIVIVALVQAALGGLTGYFIARDKFDAPPMWWMPAGLALAAAIRDKRLVLVAGRRSHHIAFGDRRGERKRRLHALAGAGPGCHPGERAAGADVRAHAARPAARRRGRRLPWCVSRAGLCAVDAAGDYHRCERRLAMARCGRVAHAILCRSQRSDDPISRTLANQHSECRPGHRPGKRPIRARLSHDH
jgi:hypothetical protein